MTLTVSKEIIAFTKSLVTGNIDSGRFILYIKLYSTECAFRTNKKLHCKYKREK